MTEVEQYQQTELAPHAPAGASGIQQTALELTGAMQIANAICNSTFVPKHFRGKAEECAVAMLYGATIGFDPVTSVQQVYVIGGTPALYSRAMVAIVLGAGHEMWTEEEKPGSVTVAGRRKGSEHVQRVTWTSEMAQQAGYTSNSKYKTDPRSMLYARASGDVARRIAPDALLGLAYNVEEMQLVSHAPAKAPATSTAKDRVRAAIGTPASAAEPVDLGAAPEIDDAEAAQYAADTQPEPTITTAQSKNLHRLVNVIGIDRDKKLEGASKVTGRAIGSTSELTKVEAGLVIDALQRKADEMEASAASAGEPEVVDADVVEDDPNSHWDGAES